MLTLTSSQSYTGATTILGGTLMLAPKYTPGAAAVTLFELGLRTRFGYWDGYGYNPAGLGLDICQQFRRRRRLLSAFRPGTPPDGNCCGFIQANDVTTARRHHQPDLHFLHGGHLCRQLLRRRRGTGGSGLANPFEVEIDGANEGTFTPNLGWKQFTSSAFSVSAGTHTLAFVGLASGTIDQTSFIDAVSINQPGTYASNTNLLPAATSLTISAGATLDLGGNNQQLPALVDYTPGSGGTVVNSITALPSTLTLSASGGTSTFSGQIAGGSGLGTLNLVMSGSGTQVLAGSNTYTGSTTINSGNLAVNGSLSPSSSVTVNSSGTLSGIGTVGSVTVSAHGTLAPGFGGGGTLTASSLSLAASSVLSYTLGSGTATDSRLGITGGLTLNPGLTLAVTPGGASWWGSGTYVLATYGSLTNNSSSFSGWTVAANPLLGRHTYAFSVSSGSLDLSVGSAAAVSGTWSASGGGSWGTAGDWQGSNIPGYVGDTATFGTGIGSTAATVTLDGARGLSGLTLSTSGGGSYTLSRTSGDTTSTLMLASSGSTVPLSVSGGSQTIAVPVTFFDNVSVSAASGASLTVSAAVSEGVAGTSLTLSGAGTLILAGANSYTGPTTVSGGTLQIGAGGAGASLASPSVSLSSNTTLAFNHSDSIIYGGAVTGNGGLSKQGAGTLTLGGSNTYGGGSTLSAGQLNLNNASALGSGAFDDLRRHDRQHQRQRHHAFHQQRAELERQLHLRRQQRPQSGQRGRQHEQQPHRDRRVQQPHHRGRDQRQRLQPDQGGRRHVDPRRRQHLRRPDRRQRRHAETEFLRDSREFVPNWSFETPNLAGGYQYDPSGATWAFVNYAGIAAGGSGFGVTTPIPDGNQVGFVQAAGNTGLFSQVINFATSGSYAISFQGTMRGSSAGTFQR